MIGRMTIHGDGETVRFEILDELVDGMALVNFSKDERKS
jgi:hypothetical protein